MQRVNEELEKGYRDLENDDVPRVTDLGKFFEKLNQEIDEEAIKSYRIQKLNEALAIGIEQLKRGEGIPLDDTSFEQLMEEIKQERNAHA
jgi:hypothetical protein